MTDLFSEVFLKKAIFEAFESYLSLRILSIMFWLSQDNDFPPTRHPPSTTFREAIRLTVI